MAPSTPSKRLRATVKKVPTDRAKLKLSSGRASRESAVPSEFDTMSSALAMVEFSPDGNIQEANDKFALLTGYLPQELVGRHHSALLDVDAAGAPEYRQFWTRLRQGETVSGEFKHVGKSGNRFNVQSTYCPVLNDEGDLLKIVAYAIDVTRLAHDREQLAQFRSVIDTSEAAFMMVDRSFTITYINQETVALLNRHLPIFRAIVPSLVPEKLVGQSIDQFHRNPNHQRQMLADPSRFR